MPTPQELGLVYDPYTGWRNPNAAQTVNQNDPGVMANYTGGGQGGQDGQSMWSPNYQGDLQYLYRPTQEGHNAVGDYQDMYSKDGKYLSSGVIPKDDTLTQFLIAGGMLGGGVGATMMGLGGAGAAAGGGMGAGDATAAGYGGLDAAGASSMGGGASLSGGAGGAGAGFAGDATAAGYGGLDAASTATMGGGASVGGGAAASGASSLLNGLGSSDLLKLAKTFGPGLLGAIAGGNSHGALSGPINGAYDYAKGLLNTPVAPNGFERFYGKK